jgi:heptaprenyl diphosphate synthase
VNRVGQAARGARAGWSANRLVRLALFVAMALIVWIVELAVPMPLAVPGAKLGLANAIILWCLVSRGFGDALLVNIVRIVLGSMLTGTFLNLPFTLALAGGLASTLVMGGLHRFGRQWLSLVGLSLAGAFTHNLAQLLAVVVVIGHFGPMIYLPYLLGFAIPTGLLVGLVVSAMGRSFPELTAVRGGQAD